jgi:hypothetical protein
MVSEVRNGFIYLILTVPTGVHAQYLIRILILNIILIRITLEGDTFRVQKVMTLKHG